MISTKSRLSVRKQSDLLGINRSTVYYKFCSLEDTERANLIAEVYSQYPMYGYRRIMLSLKLKDIPSIRKAS